MKLNNIQWVIDPQTFHRDLVANIDVSLSLEVLLDLAAVKGLDLESEIAMAIGQEILAVILPNKPPINS